MPYLSGVGYLASGYAIVKTFPHPWNMLVWKKVDTQLARLPFPFVYVSTCREKSGYAVVKTTPPPQNMLVRKEVVTCLYSDCVAV